MISLLVVDAPTLWGFPLERFDEGGGGAGAFPRSYILPPASGFRGGDLQPENSEIMY